MSLEVLTLRFCARYLDSIHLNPHPRLIRKRLHQGFQQWVKQIDGEGAIALVDQSFDVPSNPLELDALMQAHCTEVGPVNISSETHTVEFESLSHAIDAWKGSHDASALARRQAEKSPR